MVHHLHRLCLPSYSNRSSTADLPTRDCHPMTSICRDWIPQPIFLLHLRGRTPFPVIKLNYNLRAYTDICILDVAVYICSDNWLTFDHLKGILHVLYDIHAANFNALGASFSIHGFDCSLGYISIRAVASIPKTFEFFCLLESEEQRRTQKIHCQIGVVKELQCSDVLRLLHKSTSSTHNWVYDQPRTGVYHRTRRQIFVAKQMNIQGQH